MQRSDIIFQNVHSGRKIRVDNNCGNSRIDRIAIGFCDPRKVPNECVDFCFGCMQELQVVAHQDQIVANRFEIYIKVRNLVSNTTALCAIALRRSFKA